jgi:hypothetical protein
MGKEEERQMRKRKEEEKGKKALNMLDSVTMAEQVQPARAAQEEAEAVVAHSVEEVGNAVEAFLKKLPDIKRVKVTKMAQIDPEKGYWEAEAEVFVPNATIQALELPVQKEVLDCQTYLLRVDGGLRIVAYGLRDSIEE